LEFVEVENLDGRSVSVGRWVDDGEYKYLIFDPIPHDQIAEDDRPESDYAVPA
jgi:hypothetical protein